MLTDLPHRWMRHVLALTAVAWVLSGPYARADDKAPNPRTDGIIAYEADPHWAHRPSHVQWGQMPGVAIDKKGQVWIFTRADPPVQVYDTDGKFVRAWGGNGVIKTAHHIEIDPQGNVWVADLGHHTVMQFTPKGKLLETLGTRGEPGDDETHFNLPTDMAITPAGDVFVSDGYGNNRVVHFDRDGRFVKAWGKLGPAPGEFNLPHAIALDSKGRLYVADRNNGRVQIFDQQGRFLDQWRNLLVPWGLWVTDHDEIWICGSAPAAYWNEHKELGVPPKDQVFMRFTPSGKLLEQWFVPLGVEGKNKPGELTWVHGIAIDAKGNIYAGDILGERAQKFARRIVRLPLKSR